MRNISSKRFVLFMGIIMFMLSVVISCSVSDKQDVDKSVNTKKAINSTLLYQNAYDIIAYEYNQYNILEYYDSDALIELRNNSPYTYIMQKYMDIFIDYLVDIDLLSVEYFYHRYWPYYLSVESKQEFILSILPYLNLEIDMEEEDLCANQLDEFCYVLDCMFNAELNMREEIEYFIDEALVIADMNGDFVDEEILLNSSHVEIGNMLYHKLDVLLHLEDSVPFLHENEEDMENVECDCGIIQHLPSAQRVAKFNLFSLWPDGIVKYRNHQCPDIGLMDMAMCEWSTAANGDIQFVEIKDNGWNRFLWNIGCSYHVCLKETANGAIAGHSTIGYVPWATIAMNVNATNYNQYYGSYLHELGHTLGLVHEIQRCDRDNFVYIDWSNIKIAYYINFVKLPYEIATPYGAFDFNSIMMYDQDAFSRTGNYTIIPIDGSNYNRSSMLSPGDCTYHYDSQ